MLTYAIIIFIIVKVTFDFLSWFLSNDGDIFVRSKIDILWVKVHNYQLTELVSRVFERISIKIIPYVKNYKFYLLVLLLGTCLNFFLWGGIEYYYFVQNGGTYGIDEVRYIVPWGGSVWGWDGSYFTLILRCFYCAIFDVISFMVTMHLLLHVPRHTNFLILFLLFLVDMVVVYLAISWVYFIHEHTYSLNFFIPFFPHHSVYRVDFLGVLFHAVPAMFSDIYMAILGVNRTPGVTYKVIQSFSSAIPTVIYLFLILFAIIAKLTPQLVIGGLSRLIFLLTTGDKPVLSQIGTFVAGVTAILVALQKSM